MPRVFPAPPLAGEADPPQAPAVDPIRAIPGASVLSGRRAAAGGDSLALSPAAQREVARLKAIDAEVRAHEAAHLAAGGGLVRGGASFTYARGPDGRQYAVGGEVTIDSGAVPGNPRATIAKAEQVKAAALAPANPSPQDHAVAAAAEQMAAQASADLARQRMGRQEPGRFLDLEA